MESPTDDPLQLYANPSGWVCIAKEGSFTNIDSERRSWKLNSDGTWTLPDGRQLYVSLNGAIGVAKAGSHTNTDPTRRTWNINADGTVQLPDGRQLYVNPSNFACAEIEGSGANTVASRRTWAGFGKGGEGAPAACSVFLSLTSSSLAQNGSVPPRMLGECEDRSNAALVAPKRPSIPRDGAPRPRRVAQGTDSGVVIPHDAFQKIISLLRQNELFGPAAADALEAAISFRSDNKPQSKQEAETEPPAHMEALAGTGANLSLDGLKHTIIASSVDDLESALSEISECARRRLTDALSKCDPPSRKTCDVGVVGLAVMGSNLALNIADKGFQVAVFNRTWAKTKKFLEDNSAYTNLQGFETYEAFKNALKKPRRAFVLVQAGSATDATIKALAEVFERDDIIVDTGNAHFRDQSRRAEELEAKGLRFLGMGISGGEEGARKGPAFFPGGTLSVWNDIKDVVEAAAAKAVDGRPCVTMNGKGGAGSCVKMFHNAGEYAVLQIWGEVCAVMVAWGIPSEKIAEILIMWKTKTGGSHPNFMSSYMLDITVEVMKMKDCEAAGGADDGRLLLEKTMDKIGSKGTGLWSVQEALGIGCPVPSLAEAVLARQMSMSRAERKANSRQVSLPETPKPSYTEEDVDDLYWGAALSIVASYAQMFQCLQILDKEFAFGLNLPATIGTFRAGCILQGYLLQPMTKAFEDNPDLPNLLRAFAPEIAANMGRCKRLIGKVCSESNVCVPVLLASFGYIQTMTATSITSAQVTALQRDVFGRHGFKRLDKEGDFSAQWPELQ